MAKMIRLSVLLALILGAVAVIPTQAQELEKVVVGTNAEYPPFESVADDGELVGFDIDLMNAIAADAGFEVEYVNTRWDGIFVALSEGEFDAVISAATITDEREEIIDFSDPYFNAGQLIAVGADLAESVSGPDDLVGLRVGVQLGTTGDEFATALEGIEVVRFDEITLAFQALGAAEVDAVIADGPTVVDILANNPDINGVIVGEPLTEEFYGIAVNPEKPEVLDAINLSLANVIASGEYAEIYMEWFGVEPPAAFMGEAAEGDDMAAGEMELDLSSPEATVTSLINTFFGATDPAELLVFACEGGEDSPLFPSAEVLAGFAGSSVASTDKLTLEAEIDGDVAIVTATEDSMITLLLGETEQELPVSILLQGIGVTEIRLTQDAEGLWKVCPEE
jgi:polar amino acid transport system substrate-binding protein